MDRDDQASATPNEKAVEEIVRLGEVQLEDVLAMALAADSRAISQANALGAVAAALVTAAIAVAALPASTPLQVSALAVAAVGFLIAAVISMFAAQPAKFYTRGAAPSKIVTQSHEYLEILKLVANDYDARIQANRAVLARTGKYTSRAQIAAVVASVAPFSIILAGRLITYFW